MNKFMLLASAAAFAFVSGAAGAVTLVNHDKSDVSITVDSGGKKETVTLKPQGAYHSHGKDASFAIGSQAAVSGKGHDHFAIKDGKIVMHQHTEGKTVATTAPAKAAPVAKADAKAPTAKTN